MDYRRFHIPLLIGALLLALAPASVATAEPLTWTLAPSFQLMSFDAGELSDFIAPYDLRPYEGYFWMPGAAATFQYGPLYVAPTAHGSRLSSRSHSNDAWLYWGWGILDLGWRVYDGQIGSVVPFVGAGYGVTYLELEAKQPTPFERIRRDSLPLEAGVALMLLYRPTSARGHVAGALRLGYVHQEPLGDWRDGGRTYDDAPDATPRGFFLRLEIGGGATCY